MPVRWLDSLAFWWLERRMKDVKVMGCWTPIPEGCTWKTVEKFPGVAADPLDRWHTVGIKVIRKD